MLGHVIIHLEYIKITKTSSNLSFASFFFLIAKFYSQRESARSTKTRGKKGKITRRVPEIYRTPKQTPKKHRLRN